MKSQNKSVLLQPWKRCEQYFKGLVEGKEVNSQESGELGEFLKNIEFINDSMELTERGHNYYMKKFVENKEGEAKQILAESLKASDPVLLVCSVLWGNQNVTSENIWRLLLLKEMIPKKTKVTDLGSYLMLLNGCGILKYNKKKSQILVTHNPRKESTVKVAKTVIAPTTPYSNIRALEDCIRKCADYVYWFDKHFSSIGLELLSDELEANKISELRILLGNNASIDYDKLRHKFKRFSEEMKNRGIKAECRVICDKQLLRQIHGRWLISKEICFNLPPVNSIYQGQYDEIVETNKPTGFSDWWKEAHNIETDWQKIEQSIKEKNHNTTSMNKQKHNMN